MVNKVKSLFDRHGGIKNVAERANIPVATIKTWIHRKRIPSQKFEPLLRIGFGRDEIVRAIYPDPEGKPQDVEECRA